MIERPVVEVFEFVSDPSKDSLWQTTLVEFELLTDGPMRVGTRMRQVREFHGVRVEFTLEVTEYEPNRRSSVKAASGPVPLSATYLLEAFDGATRFTASGDLDAHRVIRLAEPVLCLMIGRELGSNLGHLKSVLEAKA